MCNAGCSKEEILEADGLSWAQVLARTDPNEFRARGDFDLGPPVLRNVSSEGLLIRIPSSLLGTFLLRGVQQEIRGPKGLRHVQKAVLEDLIELAIQRARYHEYRAIPYSQRFGGLRLDKDPSSVGRALRALAGHNVIHNEGQLPYQFDFMKGTPGAPTLWALCVVPQGSTGIERADRV
jgi:hypothetical protein